MSSAAAQCVRHHIPCCCVECVRRQVNRCANSRMADWPLLPCSFSFHVAACRQKGISSASPLRPRCLARVLRVRCYQPCHRRCQPSSGQCSDDFAAWKSAWLLPCVVALPCSILCRAYHVELHCARRQKTQPTRTTLQQSGCSRPRMATSTSRCTRSLMSWRATRNRTAPRRSSTLPGATRPWSGQHHEHCRSPAQLRMGSCAGSRLMRGHGLINGDVWWCRCPHTLLRL